MLYQLSYFRKCCFTISKIRTTSFRFASAKVQLFIELPNKFQEKMMKKLFFFRNRGYKHLLNPKFAPKHGLFRCFYLLSFHEKYSCRLLFLRFSSFLLQFILRFNSNSYFCILTLDNSHENSMFLSRNRGREKVAQFSTGIL